MAINEPVFVDTIGWVALLNKDDQLHVQAVALWQQLEKLHRLLVSTDWILAETGNGLARTAARVKFGHLVQMFRKSPHSQLIAIDGELFQKALDLYSLAADKTWGLVDCASFVVMRQQGIVEAVTADHHFEQAGFRCLLQGS